MLGTVHVNEHQSSIAHRRQLGLMTGTRVDSINGRGETNEKVQRVHEVKAKTNVKLVEYMPLEVEGTPRDFDVLSRHRPKKRKVRT